MSTTIANTNPFPTPTPMTIAPISVLHARKRGLVSITHSFRGEEEEPLALAAVALIRANGGQAELVVLYLGGLEVWRPATEVNVLRARAKCQGIGLAEDHRKLTAPAARPAQRSNRSRFASRVACA